MKCGFVATKHPWENMEGNPTYQGIYLYIYIVICLQNPRYNIRYGAGNMPGYAAVPSAVLGGDLVNG